MYQNAFTPVAPSISAASYTSLDTPCKPARISTIINPVFCQPATIIIIQIDRSGSPNHPIEGVGNPITLNILFNIPTFGS